VRRSTADDAHVTGTACHIRLQLDAASSSMYQCVVHQMHCSCITR
jgi:hypothetical protein